MLSSNNTFNNGPFLMGEVKTRNPFFRPDWSYHLSSQPGVLSKDPTVWPPQKLRLIMSSAKSQTLYLRYLNSYFFTSSLMLRHKKLECLTQTFFARLV